MDLSISLYPYLSNTMKCTYCNQFARYHPYYYCCFRGCVCRVHVHLNFSCYSYLAPTYQNPTHTSRGNHFPVVPSDALVLAKCKSLNCYSSKHSSKTRPSRRRVSRVLSVSAHSETSPSHESIDSTQRRPTRPRIGLHSVDSALWWWFCVITIQCGNNYISIYLWM